MSYKRGSVQPNLDLQLNMIRVFMRRGGATLLVSQPSLHTLVSHYVKNPHKTLITMLIQMMYKCKQAMSTAVQIKCTIYTYIVESG